MTPKLVPFWLSLPETSSGAGARRPFVDLGPESKWFDTLVLNRLEAGQSDGRRVYPGAEGGPEVWYYITDGEAELVHPDGKVERVRPFDSVYFSPGSGAELRASSAGPLSWLTLASAGGEPTPFSKARDRGAGTLSNSGDAKAPQLFERRRTAPRQWPANKLGASAKPWWFYTVADHSKWFHSGCVSCVPPGGASTFHTHMERYEGPYETWYIVLRGTAFIRNEHEDYLFEGGMQGVFVPYDASHQIINNGEDLLWWLTISSRGNVPLKFDVYNVPSGSDRPGYLEEYNRIIATRTEKGLPTP